MNPLVKLCGTVALLGVAWGCSNVADPGPGRVDSNTNWLLYCSTDADCGHLSCHCGVCTQSCDESDCAALGGEAVCAEVGLVENLRAVCGDGPSRHVCVVPCAVDAECADARQCVLGHCIESLWRPAEVDPEPACPDGCPETTADDTSPCYLACRVQANDQAQLCLEAAELPSETCLAVATADLEQCAAACVADPGETPPPDASTPDDAAGPGAHPVEGDSCLTGCQEVATAVTEQCLAAGYEPSVCTTSGVAQFDACASGCGEDPGSLDDQPTAGASSWASACAGWEARAFAVGSERFVWSRAAEFDSTAVFGAPGAQFVRYEAAYGLWVGLVSHDAGYRFYLSDTPEGPFLPATDYGGHGQDLCELVVPGFVLTDEDGITSGGCSACAIGTNVSVVGVEVYARGRLGQTFERRMASEWGSDQTAVINCASGPLECSVGAAPP